MTPPKLLGIALLACLVAAVFGAAPLAAWVAASNAGGTVVQEAADAWLTMTQRVGLDRPYNLLHHTIREVENPH